MLTQITKNEQAANIVAFVKDEDSYNTIRNFLISSVVTHTLVKVGSIHDAIEYIKNTSYSPEQLIVDISGLEMPLSDIQDLADVCEPNINVVVIGEHANIGLFRSLLRIGVTDYVSKPITTDLLQRCLTTPGHEAEKLPHQRVGKVIACVGARGGVGNSTIAANLAWQLANPLSRRVVLIDLDIYMGSISLMFNVQNNQGLIDALQNTQRLDQAFLDTVLVAHGPRLMTLSAESELNTIQNWPPTALFELINVLQKQFHYIILDVPLHGGILLSALLDKVDSGLFVTDTSVVALRNMLRMMQIIDPKKTVVLRNNTHPPAQHDDTRDFETALRHHIDLTVPYEERTLAEAENLGEMWNVKSPEFSQKMLELAYGFTGKTVEHKKLSWRQTWAARLRNVW